MKSLFSKDYETMTKLKPRQVDGGSYQANTFGSAGIPFKMSSRCLCDR